MENLRNRYKFNNLRNSISSLDDTTSSLSRVGDLTDRASNFGSFSGFGGSDLQTAASGHGGYGHHGGSEFMGKTFQAAQLTHERNIKIPSNKI